MVNKDFEIEVRENILNNWDDRVISKLILNSKEEGNYKKLRFIKSILEELLVKNPDVDLVIWFITVIDKNIDDILKEKLMLL